MLRSFAAEVDYYYYERGAAEFRQAAGIHRPQQLASRRTAAVQQPHLLADIRSASQDLRVEAWW